MRSGSTGFEARLYGLQRDRTKEEKGGLTNWVVRIQAWIKFSIEFFIGFSVLEVVVTGYEKVRTGSRSAAVRYPGVGRKHLFSIFDLWFLRLSYIIGTAKREYIGLSSTRIKKYLPYLELEPAFPVSSYMPVSNFNSCLKVLLVINAIIALSFTLAYPVFFPRWDCLFLFHMRYLKPTGLRQLLARGKLYSLIKARLRSKAEKLVKQCEISVCQQLSEQGLIIGLGRTLPVEPQSQ
ncbi:hypothetical protein BHE74_00000254 [Ensete ventricosum]|nr:hypothetical protein GW17_00056443 [Ensete ventricosum]RWW90698.1 hypothetical protein BHE74_00000254 [Ensete ventricosum]